MLAKLARSIPTDPGLLYEPKFDGFRCVVFRDGDEIELASRNQRPFNRYFPELIPPLLAALPKRCVVDGEVVVPASEGRGLDFDALQQRIHPAESRVRMLAEQTPSAIRPIMPGMFAWSDISVLTDISMLIRLALDLYSTSNGAYQRRSNLRRRYTATAFMQTRNIRRTSVAPAVRSTKPRSAELAHM